MMASEKSDIDDAFTRRFGELVELLGGATKAGKIAGVVRQTMDQWRKDVRRVPLAAADDLARAGGKSLAWLVGREAEARSPAVAVAEGAALPPDFITVPLLQVRASAGRGRFTTPDDLTGGEMVAFREVWLRSFGLTPGRTQVLFAVGDSMVPTIRDGDMLLIDRQIDQVMDDGIYVVVVGGGVVVKRIQLRHNGSVVLKSDNTRYDEQTIPADEVPQLVVEGRVRWVGGPI